MAIDKAKLLKSAEKFIASGKVQQAIDEYQKILKENPKDWNLMIQVGDLYLKINKTPDAIQYFQRVADHYYADGFFLKAIAIFKRINKLDPGLTEICMKLADLYLKQGLSMDAKSQLQVVAQHYVSKNQNKEAIQTFKKLVEIEPDNLRTRNELAKAYKNEGMIGDATREYLEISDQLTRKGLLKESITVLETAHKIDPRNTPVLRKILAIYTEQKEVGKATAILEESLKSDPSNPDVLALLAETYASRNQFARAHETIDQAIENSIEKEHFWVLKGDLYLKQGNLDEAFAQYSLVADEFVAREEGGKAVALLQRITRTDASFHPALQKIIEIYTLLHQESNVLGAYSALVDAYISKAMYEDAANYLEKLIEIEPENEQHQEKLEFVKSFIERPRMDVPQALADFEAGLSKDIGDLSSPSKLSKHSAVLDERTAVSKRMSPSQKSGSSSALISEGSEEEKDFVSEHLIEAEVFSKYGLIDKAVEQLQMITTRYPNSVLAHQKLREIYLEKGDRDKAVEACVDMSRILRSRGDLDQAEDLLSEARQINPNHPALEKAYLELPADLVLPEIEADASEAGEASSSSETLFTADAEEVEIEVEESIGETDREQPPDQGFQLKQSLEEIDFYRNQGLPAEAAKLLSELKEKYPDDPGVLQRLSNLDAEAAYAAGVQEPVVEIPVQEVPGESSLSGEISQDQPQQESLEGMDSGPISLQMDEASEPDELSLSIAGEINPENGRDVLETESSTEMNLDANLSADYMTIDMADESLESVEESGTQESVAEEDSSADLLETIVEETETEISQAEDELEEAEESVYKEEEVEIETPEPPPVEEDIEPPVFGELEDESPSLEVAGEDESKLKDKTAKRKEGEVSPLFEEEEDEDYFDLAAELEEGFLNVQSAVEEEKPTNGHLYSLEEILNDFKKGVEKQLGAEDYDTHYNLGIAFKEMGLIDEAIAEFQVASKDEKRFLECCSMLGLCFLEKGMPKLAIKWYQRGLESPGYTEEEYFGLRYEIGQAYEAAGEDDHALEFYLEVYGANAGYRNVAKKVKELREKIKAK